MRTRSIAASHWQAQHPGENPATFANDARARVESGLDAVQEAIDSGAPDADAQQAALEAIHRDLGQWQAALVLVQQANPEAAKPMTRSHTACAKRAEHLQVLLADYLA